MKRWMSILAASVMGLSQAHARLSTQNPDYENTTRELPDAVSRAGFEQKLDAQIPLDLTFRDEAGNEVRLGDYFGDKPVMLALVYFQCPMLCNVIMNGMMDVMKDIKFKPGTDYEIVTVSFNHLEGPELAAAKKETYLANLGMEGADKGWHFLTGDEASIAKLAETVGFTFSWVEETEEYAHASGIMIATPEGHLSHYFFGVVFNPKDVRLGLVDASQGRIGSPVDQLLLFCYHYDPASGAYSAAIMKIIQIACMVTVGLIGGFMGLSLWLEKRRRAGSSGGQHEQHVRA